MRQHVVDLGSQPIRNLAKNPRAATMTGYAASFASTSGVIVNGGPRGVVNSARWTTTGIVANASFFVWFGLSFADPVGTIVPVAGRTYRCSIWVKPDRDRTFACNAVPYAAGTYAGGEVYGLNTACPANVWTRLDVALPTRSDTTMIQVRAREKGGLDAVAGEVIEVAQPMCVEGTTLYPDADGTMPGWRWTGAANASESAGYPKLDCRQGAIAVGPVYGPPAAGTFAATGPGPTGVPGGRIDRVPGTAYGWGVYIAANLPPSGWGPPLPGGQCRVTWWERGNYSGNRVYQVVNDGATQSITTGTTKTLVGDGQWAWFDTGWVTMSTAFQWRSSAESDQHRFRAATGTVDTTWIEWSDVRYFLR